ncbi:MAG: tyrosine protein phosphatase yvh1 [Candelina submexicana]|nr:MAG: tyrosine protein phosphatase yvh1 [Candelina submexicana]
MHKYNISPIEALSRIQQSRPICEPNEGFIQQLELYHEMQTPVNLADEPAYQWWLWRRDVDRSIARGKAPEKVRFEDEITGGVKGVEAESKAGMFELKCRKCRRNLATSQYLTPHTPLTSNKDQSPTPELSNTLPSCAHYFLDPLSWMRLELEQGKYAWQGMQCSCGQWVVPAISLARGRTDEVKSRVAQDTQSRASRTPAAILVATTGREENL